MPEKVTLEVNGRRVEVARGTTVAAAVFLAGETRFRTSVTGQPRAAVCGMGICLECRVTIDNHENRRSCQIAAREGMVILTT